MCLHYVFILFSLTEVVQREQSALPPADSSTVPGIHRRGSDLRPGRESLQGHHRDLQSAESGQAAGGLEQPEQEST